MCCWKSSALQVEVSGGRLHGPTRSIKGLAALLQRMRRTGCDFVTGEQSQNVSACVARRRLFGLSPGLWSSVADAQFADAHKHRPTPRYETTEKDNLIRA